MTDTTNPNPRTALRRRWLGGGDELPPQQGDELVPDAPDEDQCDTGMDER